MELMSRVHPSVRRAGRVLIAEEDRELRRLLGDVLRADGHEVTATPAGMFVLEQLGRAQAFGCPFDLLVLGLTGRGPNAVGDVLPRLEPKSRPPVLVLTAFADETVAQAAVSLGASGVLAKPLDLLELRRLTTALVARNVAERAHHE